MPHITKDYVPDDQRQLLRVKTKSLTAEATIIRREERRTSNLWLYTRLHQHRVVMLRRTARATHIAYALIKGRRYSQIETNPKSKPDWEAVERMYMKYGPRGANGLPELAAA